VSTIYGQRPHCLAYRTTTVGIICRLAEVIRHRSVRKIPKIRRTEPWSHSILLFYVAFVRVVFCLPSYLQFMSTVWSLTSDSVAMAYILTHYLWGALFYADDIVLLSVSCFGLQRLVWQLWNSVGHRV